VAKSTIDTIIACPTLITEKVRQFEEHLETYTSSEYSEAQLRVDFLNPMLKALGWDVDNENDHAEAYRDVVYEDAIKVGGTTKAPDYGFYIGGRAAGGGRKFFLEAKKPKVAIHVDPKPAFQLRRYAYSAQLPLSILTNFKEFIAYDTRYKPNPKDSATAAVVLRIKYTQYAERWHEIASVFSKDAILRGAFDKFAQGKRKRGMEPLGDSFLKDIEGWRDLLAREINASNPNINVDDLNFAVQRTIDRILFLRICEDRGIEPPGNLMQLLNGDTVYARLGKIFRDADDRYNSGIFHFPAVGKKPDSDRAEPPDDLTLDLTIDDQPLKNIIRGLYDTGNLFTTYAFAVIPPEILGHVYEQFLGKVIRLTPKHHVKIEEKPEVRKAGGVYYTPIYIVDYIVKNTVGKLLEGKSPKEAAKIRILDPASGSGSFLIGAYQFLLDWHLRWYLKNDPEKYCKGKNPLLMRIHSPSLDGERDAPRAKKNGKYDYRLTTSKRKAILLNSIYGVDIDPQAVEVTKLSLLLKVLEGESKESVAAQMKFLHQRALPDLGRNIKCGNSLIGDDFDDSDLSEEERKKINRFNWKIAFPKIFKSGGFDVVVGNPPWGAQMTKAEEEYLSVAYRSGVGRTRDTYALFIESGTRSLRKDGYLGFITPDTFLRKDDHRLLRELFFRENTVHILCETGPLFSQVRDTWCLVFVLQKGAPAVSHSTIHHKISRFVVSVDERLAAFAAHKWTSTEAVRQSIWLTDPNTIIGYLANDHQQHIIQKLSQRTRLGELQEQYRVSRGDEGSKFKVKASDRGEMWFVIPENVERYVVASSIRVRQRSLAQGKVISIYSYPKIWIIRIQKMRWRRRLVCAFDQRRDSAGIKTLQTVVSVDDNCDDLKYLQGLLASELMNFWCINFLADDMNKSYLEKLPIRTIDFSNKTDKAAHDRMVKLVDRMLDLHKKLAAAKSPLDKERIPRDIEATDRQIDRLVYDLYGLTDEEIAVVEDE